MSDLVTIYKLQKHRISSDVRTMHVVMASNLTYRAYSMGNRSLEIDQNDFRLVLPDSQNREIMPLKKFNTVEVAKMELDILAKRLGLQKV